MSLLLGDLISPVVEPQRPRLRARRAGHARHVALTLPMGGPRFQELLRGVVEWASRKGDWALTTFSRADEAIPDLSDWHGDGVIGAMRCASDERALTQAGLSCVNVNAAFAAASGVPLVTVDDVACGALAADHLLACGFRQFAFYGLRGSPSSWARHDGFVQRVRAHRPDAEVVASLATPQPPATAEAELIALTAWLRRVQTPIGIFAADERLARRVLDACRALRLRVPEQIAVLGVDDALVVATPAATECAVSSIACDWWRTGYEAAALLDELMRGGDAEIVQERLIQPVGLMKRASTDVMLVENQSVAKAIEFVRSHISEVFGVEALLRVTGAPRRTLELEFRRSMGCTPYQFIARARVTRARELLSAPTPTKLTAIAAACGFADLRRFRLVFRRETGMSPAEYRAAQSRPLRQP